MKRLAVAILLFAPDIYAQWSRIGPPGGGVNAIRFVGDHVYAAANGGVFGSSDRGATWMLLAKVPGFDAALLAVDPRLPDDLYVVFAARPFALGTPYFTQTRLFKSSDGGAAWHEATRGLPSEMSISALSIDPFTPTTVYLGLTCTEAAFKSACGACAATRPAGAGIYKSIDSGETWALSSNGLSDHELCIRGIAPDPVVPNRIYSHSLVYDYVLFTRHSISTDGGATWEVFDVDDAPSRNLVVHPSGRRFAISDYDKSSELVVSNDGVMWRSISGTLRGRHIDSFAVDPTDDAIIYAATDGGLFRTSDAGIRWTVVAAWARYGSAKDIIIDDRRLYLSAVAGLFISSDSGTTWSELSVGQVATTPRELVFDPAGKGRIYCALRDPIGPPVVVRSSDGGQTWESLTKGLDGIQLSYGPMAITADGTLFVAMGAFNTRALLRFDGFERTQLPLPGVFPLAMVADAFDPTTLYMATNGPAGQAIFRRAIGARHGAKCIPAHSRARAGGALSYSPTPQAYTPSTAQF